MRAPREGWEYPTVPLVERTPRVLPSFPGCLDRTLAARGTYQPVQRGQASEPLTSRRRIGARAFVCAYESAP